MDSFTLWSCVLFFISILVINYQFISIPLGKVMIFKSRFTFRWKRKLVFVSRGRHFKIPFLYEPMINHKTNTYVYLPIEENDKTIKTSNILKCKTKDNIDLLMDITIRYNINWVPSGHSTNVLKFCEDNSTALEQGNESFNSIAFSSFDKQMKQVISHNNMKDFLKKALVDPNTATPLQKALVFNKLKGELMNQLNNNPNSSSSSGDPFKFNIISIEKVFISLDWMST